MLWSLVALASFAGPAIAANNVAAFSSITYRVGDPFSSSRTVTDNGTVQDGVAFADSAAGDNGFYSFVDLNQTPPRFANITSSVFAVAHSTGTVGKLSASGSANVDSGLDNAAFKLPPFTFVSANISAYSNFSEKVILVSANPNGGSDFKFELGLTATIKADATFYPNAVDDGIYYAAANADLDATGDRSFNFNVTDSKAAALDDAGVHDEYHPYDLATIHVDYNQPVKLTLSGSLGISIGAANTTALLSVDASHTALYAISSDDPLASYTTESGAVFATSVPEPAASCVTLGIAAGTLMRRRQRR